MAENDVFQQAAVSAGEQAVCGNFRGHDSALPVIASAAKQSISPQKERMDCFVASLLAMTA
jgi:hypothetical protein